jgi:DNA-binding IclR family transcriptional regulator
MDRKFVYHDREEKDPPGSPVLTLMKALDVLETAAEGGTGITVAEIAARLGLNRSTTHRLVQTLVQQRYLQPAAVGRGLEIGLKFLPLAARQLDTNRVRIAALPHLSALAREAGERANLGVLFEDQLLYLAGAEKPDLPIMYSRFGKLAPAYCCSLGKAILSTYGEASQRAFLARRPLVCQTPNTRTTIEAVITDLAETARRRYAIDDEEHIAGSWCVAAPVYDAHPEAVAAVGISGGSREQILDMAETVRRTAQIITHLLSPLRPL